MDRVSEIENKIAMNELNAAQVFTQMRQLITKDEWISVDGFENMPVGDWIVELNDGKTYIANIHKNLSTVGGHFAFDHKPVVYYCAIPSRLAITLQKSAMNSAPEAMKSTLK